MPFCRAGDLVDRDNKAYSLSSLPLKLRHLMPCAMDKVVALFDNTSGSCARRVAVKRRSWLKEATFPGLFRRFRALCCTERM